MIPTIEREGLRFRPVTKIVVLDGELAVTPLLAVWQCGEAKGMS